MVSVSSGIDRIFGFVYLNSKKNSYPVIYNHFSASPSLTLISLLLLLLCYFVISNAAVASNAATEGLVEQQKRTAAKAALERDSLSLLHALGSPRRSSARTHKHTHTHTHIYGLLRTYTYTLRTQAPQCLVRPGARLAH